MKTLSQILIALLTTMSAHSWMHPFPDHARQFEASDMVAIASVIETTDTGATALLDGNSKILFRNFEAKLKVLSVIKGTNTNAVYCRLYRFPTKQERVSDLGEREAMRQYVMATPWETALFVPKQHREYLVYLKRSDQGYFLPAEGILNAAYSFLELKVPFESDPDREIKPKHPGPVINPPLKRPSVSP